MDFTFKTLTKTRLKYILKNRLAKDLVELDENRFTELMLSNKDYFRTFYYKEKYLVGVVGFLPFDKGLSGYLILTKHHNLCSFSLIKAANRFLSHFDSTIRFVKHHDVDYINKWYKLLGFTLEGNYWIRR